MELIKGMSRKEYYKRYYMDNRDKMKENRERFKENNPDYQKQYREKRLGKYIYCICVLDHSSMFQYMGSTVDIVNRVSYHKYAEKGKIKEIREFYGENTPIAILYLDLSDIQYYDEDNLKDIEQHLITRYRCNRLPFNKFDTKSVYNEMKAVGMMNYINDEGYRWKLYSTDLAGHKEEDTRLADLLSVSAKFYDSCFQCSGSIVNVTVRDEFGNDIEHKQVEFAEYKGIKLASKETTKINRNFEFIINREGVDNNGR